MLRKPTKDVPPEPLWKGPLLGPRSLLFVLAPTSSDKAGFCRRLAQKFGGACLSTEELAKAEAEKRRAMAFAREQEMRALVVENE